MGHPLFAPANHAGVYHCHYSLLSYWYPPSLTDARNNLVDAMAASVMMFLDDQVRDAILGGHKDGVSSTSACVIRLTTTIFSSLSCKISDFVNAGHPFGSFTRIIFPLCGNE